jgi:L-rhamnose-H+ transport protein
LSANPFFGVGLHALGGFAAGSFYIPFRRVRGWAWESYWLIGGVFSWLVAPWLVAALVVPDISAILAEAPPGSLWWSYFFGLLWGIGGLTFGLSMRYLGMSLGYALALGFCAAFGTLVPPLFNELTGMSQAFSQLLHTTSGQVTLAGVGVCLAGIALAGLAGVRKERELSAEQKTATIREFSFVKGVWVATFAGIMSACMAFGFEAGRPIAELAVKHGVGPLWQNLLPFCVIVAGGFTTNCLWCVFLNLRNRTGRDYGNTQTPLLANYILSALAGTTWYFQFFFFGMGKTQMGRYDFSSWTIHMAFIIVFSSLWGLAFREWRASSRRTLRTILVGIVVLVGSTVVIACGNYLATVPGSE